MIGKYDIVPDPGLLNSQLLKVDEHLILATSSGFINF